MGKWTQEDIETLRAMRAQGKTPREMAETLGRPRERINDTLHRLGLTSDGQWRTLRVKSERQGDAERINGRASRIGEHLGYEAGYVLGTLLGDGSISHQKRGGVVTRLEVNDREFVEKFVMCLGRVSPESYIRTFDYTYTQGESLIKTATREVIRKAQTVTHWIATCCDPVVASFSEGLISHFHAGVKFSDGMRLGILEGLLDSEGYFVSTIGYAGLFMMNHVAVRWVAEELSSRGIDNRVYHAQGGLRVSVHRRAAVRKFCETVKFSVPHREKIRTAILEA